MKTKKVSHAWKLIAIILICFEVLRICYNIYSVISYNNFIKGDEELDKLFEESQTLLIEEGYRLCSNKCIENYDYDLFYNIYDEVICVCYDEDYNIIKSSYFGED